MFTKDGGDVCFFFEHKETKEEKKCVKEDISHMCEGRLFIGKNVCKQEHGRRLCDTLPSHGVKPT